MTKTEASAPLKAFATIRFEGDALDTKALGEVLRVPPTLAFAKGETYPLGKRGIAKVGRTGCWFLNTQTYLETSDLDAHVSFLTKLLTDSRSHAYRDHKFRLIKALVEREALSVLVTLFWFGRAGAQPPEVGSRFLSLIAGLGGAIETDFAGAASKTESVEGHAA